MPALGATDWIHYQPFLSGLRRQLILETLVTFCHTTLRHIPDGGNIIIYNIIITLTLEHFVYSQTQIMALKLTHRQNKKIYFLRNTHLSFSSFLCDGIYLNLVFIEVQKFNFHKTIATIHNTAFDISAHCCIICHHHCAFTLT